jgi:hypothetical protein
MFTPLKKLLPEWEKKAGVTAGIGVMAVFPLLVAKFLPDAPYEAARPTQLSAGQLTVACRTSAVASRLRMLETSLIAELHARCPDEPVDRMRFVLSTWR